MIPEEWHLTLLSTLFQGGGYFKDGDWIETKDQDPNGDVRLIQLADIGDGYFINKSSRFLTTQKASKLKCTFIDRGDILVARMPEPLGRACIFPGVGQKAVTVVDVCILKLDPNFDSKWLMFALNNPIFRNVIYSKATGTTRVRISKKNLQSIEILLPPLSEQKRIAEILTSVDDAIQATEKVISQTKRVKQGLLQELFTRGIGHSKFKKTEIGEIPSGWAEKKLVDIALVNPRRVIPKGTVVKYVEMAAVSATDPSITHILEREFKGSGSKFKNDDTLFARITPCAQNGKTSFVNYLDSNECGAGSTELIVLSPKESKCDPKYLYFLTRWDHIRSYAISKMEGTSGRQRVPARVFSEINLGVPPLPEQKRIAEILTSADDAVQVAEKVLEQTKRVKQGLLQDLLTGRVRTSGVP